MCCAAGRSSIGRGHVRCAARFGFDPDDAIYFIGRETVIPRGSRLGRIPGVIYRILHRNATGSSAYFRLPPERVFEIGMQIGI